MLAMLGSMGRTSSGPVNLLGRRRGINIPPRYRMVFVCFLATFTAYVERVGFSIAFTAMAKEANLDESVKGTVLSAFYWGYALSQVSPRYALCTIHLAGQGQLAPFSGILLPTGSPNTWSEMSCSTAD